MTQRARCLLIIFIGGIETRFGNTVGCVLPCRECLDTKQLRDILSMKINYTECRYALCYFVHDFIFTLNPFKYRIRKIVLCKNMFAKMHIILV